MQQVISYDLEIAYEFATLSCFVRAVPRHLHAREVAAKTAELREQITKLTEQLENKDKKTSTGATTSRTAATRSTFGQGRASVVPSSAPKIEPKHNTSTTKAPAVASTARTARNVKDPAIKLPAVAEKKRADSKTSNRSAARKPLVSARPGTSMANKEKEESKAGTGLKRPTAFGAK